MYITELCSCYEWQVTAMSTLVFVCLSVCLSVCVGLSADVPTQDPPHHHLRHLLWFIFPIVAMVTLCSMACITFCIVRTCVWVHWCSDVLCTYMQLQGRVRVMSVYHETWNKLSQLLVCVTHTSSTEGLPMCNKGNWIILYMSVLPLMYSLVSSLL